MSSHFQIGSITTGYRRIRSGSEYDRYFPLPQDQDRLIIEDGEVDQTVDLMKRVVWKYIEDTRGISQVLKGSSKRETCRNIWDFLFHHIQYRLDKQGLEQLRRPARSWADRREGIDCDCFSIFCSSILTNLKIPHAFRITKYGGTHYQHVYVVVPNGAEFIIIDAVLSSFDYEKPFTQKKDFTMNLSGIDVAVLSGHNEPLNEVLFGMGSGDDPSQEAQLQALSEYLVATRNSIAQNPAMISSIEDPEGFIKMLDYALMYWNTDKRDEALAILAANELQINQNLGLFGADVAGYDYEYSSLNGFFDKIGDAVKKIGTGVANTGRTVVKAVVRYNPVSIVARLGFLAAMRLNLKQMASKLKWAYATQAAAESKGISGAEWNKARTALTRIESLFADKLQGNRQALKDAILKGRAGGLGYVDDFGHYVPGLGEPVTLTASIAAATPVIIAAIKIMQETGLFKPGEDVSTNNLAAEAEATERGTFTTRSVVPASNFTVPVRDFGPSTAMPAGSSPMAVNASANANGAGLFAFVKNNPAIAIAGASAVVFGAYMLLKPNKARRGSLAGPGNKNYRKKTASAVKRGRSNSKYSTIKKLNLK